MPQCPRYHAEALERADIQIYISRYASRGRRAVAVDESPD